MTTRTLAHAARLRFLPPALLALALLAPASARSAEDFALECDVVAGIMSLRLTGPEEIGIRGSALDGRTWVFEIDDPSLIGLRPGPHPCVSAQSVRVLPGYLLGTFGSRIVVTHSGEAPRSFSQPGRQRLTWLPEPRQRVAGSEPAPDLEAEATRAKEDERRALLEAEVQAQLEENARLRRRLAEEEATVAERPVAQEPPSDFIPGPGKKELRQQAKAEKRAAREAERAEARARKQAKREKPPPPPVPEQVPQLEPVREMPPPARQEPRRQAAMEREPTPAAPERERVVVHAPAQPAATPRALPPDFAHFPSPTTLVVTIPTDLKDGPGRRYRTLRRMGAGERVSVSGRASDWYRVGSGEGWVFSTYLESASPQATSGSQLGVIQEVTVPVLEGPGGQHAVVAELYRGQQVVIDELKEEWAHVRNGGWVRRSALGELKPGQER